MIGHNVISEFTERTDHMTSVKAKTDGLMAVLPFNEIKIEVRKNPDTVRISTAYHYRCLKL